MLEALIAERATRRTEITTSLVKLKYATNCFFEPLSHKQFKKALYVGVGHGHDALLALQTGIVENVVGCDPFLENDGNGDRDWLALTTFINNNGLSERFAVRRTSAAEFLQANKEKFDLVVMADVAHHMWVTKHPLNTSALFESAVEFFRLLRLAAPESYLAFSDVQRHGLRQWLNRLGILRGCVDYTTKQSHKQWALAICAAEWKPLAMQNYVPYNLRMLGKVVKGRMGRWTVCDRYHMYFKN